MKTDDKIGDQPPASPLLKAIVHYMALMVEGFTDDQKRSIFKDLHHGRVDKAVERITKALREEHPVNVEMGVNGALGSFSFFTPAILAELKDDQNLAYVGWFFRNYMLPCGDGFIIGRPDTQFGDFSPNAVIFSVPVGIGIKFSEG